MRFVIIQPHLKFGGAERQTVLVANRLVEQGHSCTVILHKNLGGLVDDLSPLVDIHDLNLESHGAIPVAALKLRRVLGRMPRSYVIVKLWSSILATSLIERSCKQHIFNYCEDLDPDDHAEFIRFGELKQRMIARIFRRKASVTANTYRVAEKMALKYRLAHVPDVIPSTVDGSAIRKRAGSTAGPAPAPGQPLKVCSVGSLIERKGLRTTASALARVAESRDVEWHVIGEGPLRDQVPAMAGSIVKTVMHGGHANPYSFMSDCDVLVHSAVSEAFGIVIPESLALGLPVVAANSIGPVEITHVLGSDSRMLVLYSVGDADSLVAALETLLATRRPELAEFDEYISDYALTRAVELWVERASKALELPARGVDGTES